MDANIHFDQNLGEPLADLEEYRRLIGELIYLTSTRPVITFAVSMLSRYMQSPYQLYCTAACNMLRYLKGASGKGCIIIFYLIWILWDILILIGLVILLIVILLLVITFLLEAIW